MTSYKDSPTLLSSTHQSRGQIIALCHLLGHQVGSVTSAHPVSSLQLQLARRQLETATATATATRCLCCTAHGRIVVVHLVHGEALLYVGGKVAGGALEGSTAAVVPHVPI